MNETTNLKLKKPAGNEYISVETINGNMDIIDTGMKEISDSVDAPEFDASGTVEGITDKAGLLASFVTRMPLVKFMRNVVAGFKLVLYAGQVVNNCVTDNAGLPLSAAQGKVLMDLYTVLNTKIDAFEAPWDELYNGLPASLPIIDLSGYKSFRLQLYAVDGTATGGWYDFDVDINSSRIEISYFQTTSIYKRVLMGFNSKHLGFISQAQGTWTTSSLYLIVQAK